MAQQRILVIVLCLCLSSHAAAETYQVPSQFEFIQEAVAAAQDGDAILVAPGLYFGEIRFEGKAITIQGVPDHTGAPILTHPGGSAVACINNETKHSVLRNFVIKESFIGVFLSGSGPTLTNLTIVDNGYGIQAHLAGASPDIRNCIFWRNSKSDLFGCDAKYSWTSKWVNHPLTDGLVGYWSFDDTSSGTAFDSFGGHHGMIRGATKTSGVFGHGLFFDGQDDYVDCGSSEDFKLEGDLSVAFWVFRYDQLKGIFIASEGSSLDKGSTEDNSVLFLRIWSENQIVDYIHEYEGGLNQRHYFPSIPTDQWVHVAVTRDASNREVKIYYDGQYIETYHYAHHAVNSLSQLNLTMGSRSQGRYPFYGYLDEVVLYNRPLSETEIMLLASTNHRYLTEDCGFNTKELCDPLFANPNQNDYHLLSERGRFHSGLSAWVPDTSTSVCIDSGDPNSVYAKELTPKGDRINQGVYGNTPFASKSIENQAPTVTLNSIEQFKSLLVIDASANDTDGSVKQVDFFINGVLSKSDTTSQNGWTCFYFQAQEGKPYRINIVAVDNQDLSGHIKTYIHLKTDKSLSLGGIDR